MSDVANAYNVFISNSLTDEEWVDGWVVPQLHAAGLSILLSLVKSCRAISHKVMPVRLVVSIISRHADGEKGKAS